MNQNGSHVMFKRPWYTHCRFTWSGDRSSRESKLGLLISISKSDHHNCRYRQVSFEWYSDQAWNQPILKFKFHGCFAGRVSHNTDPGVYSSRSMDFILLRIYIYYFTHVLLHMVMYFLILVNIVPFLCDLTQ